MAIVNCRAYKRAWASPGPAALFLAMPAVTSGRVLVTGANGFVAGWITKTLLEHGFSVRATVRSPGKADPIREALSAYRERLQFVVVKDITQVSWLYAASLRTRAQIPFSLKGGCI